MGKAVFCIGLHSKIENISVVLGSAQNDINRLINGVPSEQCTLDTDATQTGIVEIVIEFSTTQVIQVLSVINHTIPATATMNVQFSNNGTNWEGDVTLTHNTKNMYVLFEREYLYLKLHVDIGEAASIKIGGLFQGDTFKTNFSFPYNPVYISNKNITIVNGQHFEEQISEQNKYVLPFKMISPLDWTTFAYLHRAGPKLLIPDDSLPYCYQGCVPAKVYNPKRKKPDVLEFNIEFIENAILGDI